MNFTDDEEVIAYFTEGQCNALAFEIHKLTGMSLGLISDMPAGSMDYIGHVFNFDSDGMVIDIRGRRTLDKLKYEWVGCKHLHRFISLKEFEYEMLEWDNRPRYDRDDYAKLWASKIVDML